MVSASTADLGRQMGFAIGGITFVLMGLWYFRHPRRLAVMIADQIAKAPRWRRLGMPSRFWSERHFLVQLRGAAVGTIGIGLLLIFCAIASLIQQL